MPEKIKCFVVYSSKRHVDYIDNLLDKANELLEKYDFKTIYLGEKIRSTQSYLIQLRNLVEESKLGLVILDGFRPNVLYELGLLQGLNIPIILMKSKAAKINIKNLYSDREESGLGPVNFESKLQNPTINLASHFSDYGSSVHIAEFSVQDDENKFTSFCDKLNEEIKNIIPELQIHTKETLEEIKTKFPNIDQTILLLILKGLALFSYIGWESRSVYDDEFQDYHKDFCSILQIPDKIADVEQIIISLIDKSVVQKRGRYIYISSKNLTQEIINNMQEHNEIYSFFERISSLDNQEFFRRFIERLLDHADLPISQQISGAILRSDYFDSWKIFEDPFKSNVFQKLAYINPFEAIETLNRLFSDVSNEEIKNYYAQKFTENPHYPMVASLDGAIEGWNLILWSLDKIAHYKECFKDAVSLLFRFSVIEEKTWVNSATSTLASFFYPITFSSASIQDRIEFINSIDITETMNLNCLVSIINHVIAKGSILNGEPTSGLKLPNKYYKDGEEGRVEREEYRKFGYDLILKLFESENPFIQKEGFNLINHNLSNFLLYYGWNKLKEIWLKYIDIDENCKYYLIKLVNEYQKYENWRKSLSEEDLTNLKQFKNEIIDSFSFREEFKHYINSDILNSEYDIHQYDEYKEKLRKSDLEYAKTLYNNDSKFTEVSGIIFNIGTDRLSEIAYKYSEIDERKNFAKWDLIKSQFLNLDTKTNVDFIYTYLYLIWRDDNEKWKKIYDEIIGIEEFNPFLAKLLLHHKIDDFQIEKIIEFSDKGILNFKDIKSLGNFDWTDASTLKITDFLKLYFRNFEFPFDLELNFVKTLFEQREEIIELVKDELIEFLTNFQRQPVNYRIPQDWFNLAEIFVNACPDSEEALLNRIFSTFEEMPILTMYENPIEKFVINSYKRKPEGIVNLLKDIFSDKHLKRILEFRFGNDLLNNLKWEDIESICNEDESNILIIARMLKKDMIKSSSEIPDTLTKLLTSYPDNVELKNQLIINIKTRIRAFSRNISESIKSDIRFLEKWKRKNQNTEVGNWIDYAIEHFESEIQDEHDRFDETYIR